MRYLLASLLALAAFAPTAAEAAPSEKPPWLRYVSTADCPTDNVFSATVARRLSESLQTSAHTSARAYSARIERDPATGKLRGTLTIEAAGSGKAERAVLGDTCAEVAEALALVTVVLINPETHREAPADHAVVAEGAQVTPLESTRTGARAPRASWSFELGVQFDVTTAVAPKALLVPRASVMVAPPGPWSLRALLGRAESGTIDGVAGDATLEFLVARLEFCRSLVWFRTELCALTDVARLHAEGHATREGRARDVFWIAPGLEGRVGIPLGTALAVDGHLGAFFPLVRPRFVFGLSPSGVEPVHSVAAIGLVAGLALSARL